MSRQPNGLTGVPILVYVMIAAMPHKNPPFTQTVVAQFSRGLSPYLSDTIVTLVLTSTPPRHSPVNSRRSRKDRIPSSRSFVVCKIIVRSVSSRMPWSSVISVPLEDDLLGIPRRDRPTRQDFRCDLLRNTQRFPHRRDAIHHPHS